MVKRGMKMKFETACPHCGSHDFTMTGEYYGSGVWTSEIDCQTHLIMIRCDQCGLTDVANVSEQKTWTEKTKHAIAQFRKRFTMQ